MQRVMAFENSTVPMSIFAEDGSMLLPRAKSDFLQKIESLIPGKVYSITSVDCTVYDGYAIVQQLPFPAQTEEATFKDLATKFGKYIQSCANTC